jgi:hypothetical protein
MDDINTKPKKVLSEAQRLAFLKGREKRMANIEKKRLEKLEADMASEEFTLPQAPPAPPKRTRTSKKKDSKPEPEEESKLVAEPQPDPEPDPQPEPDPEPENKTTASLPTPIPSFDEDSFLEKIVGKLKETIQSNQPPAKPALKRAPRKTRAVRVPDQEDPIPAINNFSWL